MKIIRLTYHNTEVVRSTYLLLFFRMAGIYVYERFWEEASMRKSIEMPVEVDEQQLTPFENFDVDLFFGVAGEQGNMSRLFKTADNVPNVFIEEQFNIDERQFADRVLGKLRERQIIEQREFDDLQALLNIYASQNVHQLALKTKYFFPVTDVARQLADDYRRLWEALLEGLKREGVEWGQNSFEHLQFAAISTAYDSNRFCRARKSPLIFVSDTMINVCDRIQLGFGDYLGDSIRMLKGMIYDDLLDNSNKAYEFFVNSCNSKTTYNSYVFFRKGLYWQYFADHMDNAVKYYNKSVGIFREYYRAWFKIGFCCHKAGRYKEALGAYNNVKNILYGRLRENWIRPLEIEHLFKAQLQSLVIWEEVYNNIANAIEAGRVAEMVWQSIDSTMFFQYMCIDEHEEQQYREYTRENISIDSVYAKMVELYKIEGNRDKVQEYENKINALS